MAPTHGAFDLDRRPPGDSHSPAQRSGGNANDGQPGLDRKKMGEERIMQQQDFRCYFHLGSKIQGPHHRAGAGHVAPNFNTVQAGIVPYAVELINGCTGSTQGQIFLEFSM